MDTTYLEIEVGQNTFLVPIASTQEVLNISAGLIVPVANMPKSILGLLNHGSRIYWTLDLAEVLGLSTSNSLRANLVKYPILIVSVKDEVMAIAAEIINGIHKIYSPIQPLSTKTPQNLRPYLVGYVNNVGVLDPEAVLKIESN